MEVCFFFGPDKVPFSIVDNGVVKPSSTMPFHGIISRGLLNKFIAQDLNFSWWHQYTHGLFDSTMPQGIAELEKIRQSALECKVLSFGQSSFCVQKYVAHYCEQEKINDVQIELWNIKEGHTSSVWKVTLTSEVKIETFAINVARDLAAGVELKESSENLKTIGIQFPELNLAKVLDIFVLQDRFLPSQVVVTRNEWIDNAYEIHSRKNKQTGKDELLMVERFLTHENNPAHITSVWGRIFTTEEVRKIKYKISEFLTCAITCLPIKPEININDGDVVWDGDKAIVVALS